jgi:hypothetical protein
MAKMVKKAQDGRIMESPKKSEFRPGQIKRMDRVFNANPDRGIKVAKRMLKRKDAKDAAAAPMMKKGGKAKNGTSFGMLSVKAGVDNNPSATFADKIAGAKKKAKSGKKMQYGGEAASMVPMMKKGGMKKKYKHGGTVSMQLGSYDRQIGKNYTGKATKAVGLVKAMYGKSIMKKGGKCKNGC